MNKAFENFEWENSPSDKSPLNRRNLMRINNGLDEVDDRVIVLDITKFDKIDAQGLIKSLTFNRTNGVFTITYFNGSTATIDTMLEKIAVNFDFDEEAQQLVIVLDDGTERRVDLSAFIKPIEFVDSTTIAWRLLDDGKVSAIVKEGSIEEKHLRPDYLADVKIEAGKAQKAAEIAMESAASAEISASGASASEKSARESEENAKRSEENTEIYSLRADNYAVDAGISAGNALSHSENAHTYAQEAKASKEDAEKSATSAKQSEERADSRALYASEEASNAHDFAKEAQSYAHGGTGIRPGEDTDSAEYYYEQSKAIYDDFSSAGNVIGVKGEKEAVYREGFVNLTPEDIGALPTEGGILTGDVALPITKSSKDSSIPVAGSTMGNLADITNLKNYKTYLGAVQINGVWNNIVSIRHRNGASDGVNYGMYIRSPLTSQAGLAYNKQMGDGKWQGERTLLDSSGFDMSNMVYLRKGFNVHTVKPYNSTNGYANFAELTVQGTYANSPIVFEIIKRNSTHPTILSIVFAQANTLDPGLGRIQYYGSKFRIYIVRTGEPSKWNLYIECSAYDDICILNAKYSYTYPAVQIAWKTNFVEELPEGTIEATYALEASNADTVDGMHADEFLPKNGGTIGYGNSLCFGGNDMRITSKNGWGGEGLYIESDIDGIFFNQSVTIRGSIAPYENSSVDCGDSSRKWRNIYAANGVIQTSDRTQKKDIEELDLEKIKDFMLGLITCSYKMVDGTSGRTHYGLIAQDVEALMEKLGMDTTDFAGLIKSPKVIIRDTDENGNLLKNPIEEIVEGEYDYALRYDEFIAPLIKMVQDIFRKCDEFDRRLVRIEEALGT